jgi:uncharacterized tellurite resistance protein B-like protein
MLGKLESWIKTFSSDTEVAPKSDHEWAETVAGLLIEAAMADGILDKEERKSISAMLVGQLDLAAEDVDGIIDAAVAAHDQRIEIHSLTRAIRAETEAEDRVAIMEMAWMVVLADGEVHEYEAQLMRRLAGLLYVADSDSGHAAKRAKARLGIAS